ncbi:MAG: hypothetical protein OXC44_04550 [Proteobacteria bacterium]|nr:hypothetical protein [Pseudomonadota bacterium]
MAVITKNKEEVIETDTVTGDGVMDINIRKALEYSKSSIENNANMGTLLLYDDSFSNFLSTGSLGSILRRHYYKYSNNEDYKVHLEFRLHKKEEERPSSHYRSLVFTPEQTKTLTLLSGYYSFSDEFDDLNIKRLQGFRVISSTDGFYAKTKNNPERIELVGFMKDFISSLFKALDSDI